MHRFFFSACIFLCISQTGNAQSTFREIDAQLSAHTHPDSVAQVLSKGVTRARQLDHLHNWVSYTLEYISVSEHYLYAFTGDTVRALWRDPATTEEAEVAVQYYRYLGYACAQAGDIPLAIQYYEYALAAHDKFNTQDTEVFDEILKPLGNHYLRAGDFAHAGRILYRMHDWAGLHPHPDHRAAVANYTGLLHKLKGDPAEAKRYYMEGLGMSQASPDIHGKIASNMSLLCSELGDDRAAETYAGQAIALLTRIRMQQRDVDADLAVAHLILAQVALNRVDLVKAYDAINTAMSFASSTDKRTYAKMCVVRGRILRLAGYPAEAMTEFNIAIRQFIPEFSPERPHDHPSAVQLPAENTIFEAMEGKADVLSDLYTTSGDPDWLEYGMQAHSLALDSELLLRRQLSTEVSRNILTANSRRRTAKALGMLAQLQHVRPDAHHALRAYDIMEATRSISVLEELAMRIGESPEQTDKSRELASTLRIRERELHILRRAAVPDIAKIDSVARVVNSLKLRIAEFRSGGSPHMTSLLKSDTMRYHPVDGQLLISYYLQDDTGYAVVVYADGTLTFHQLEDVPGIRIATQELVSILHARAAMQVRPEYFGERALSLYQRLITAFIDSTRTFSSLIVVPDGILSYLPFEVLLPEYYTRMDYSTMPYLICDVVIQYAYSARVVSMQEALISGDGGGIAFAPFDRDRRGIAGLEYSMEEVRAGNPFGVEIYQGAQASFARFLELAGESRIIHLATHAGVDSTGAGYIEFADSTMLLSDVYSLALRCRLAILSACESAFGTHLPGEGIQNFVRAFAIAGTKAILSSHWNLNDAAGAQIVRQFYAYLSRGESAATALRQAKLDYLSDDRVPLSRKAPHYWASLVLNGTDVTIKSTRYRTWLSAIMVIVVAGVFIAIIWWMRRRRI